MAGLPTLVELYLDQVVREADAYKHEAGAVLFDSLFLVRVVFSFQQTTIHLNTLSIVFSRQQPRKGF